MRDFSLVGLDPAQVLFPAHAALAVQVNSRLDPPLAERNRLTLLGLQIGGSTRCPVGLVGLNREFGHQVDGLWAHTQQLDQAREIILVHLAAHRSVGTATGDAQLMPVAGDAVALHAAEWTAQLGVVVLSGQPLAVGTIRDTRQRVEVRVFHHSLIDRTQRAFLAHLRDSSEQFQRENGPIRQERKLVHSVVFIGRTVFGLPVHDNSTILRPVRHHAPHVIPVDQARRARAVAESPPFLVELVGNLFQPQIPGRIERKDVPRRLVVTAPQCSILRWILWRPGDEGAIGEDPGALGRWFEVAILIPGGPKRRHPNGLAQRFAVLHTILGALRDVLGVVFVNDRRKLNEKPAQRGRGVHFTARSSEDQGYIELLQVVHQITHAPAFAVQTRQVVGDQGDHIRITQARLQSQPFGAVLLLAR